MDKIPGRKERTVIYNTSLQRHHDYYVSLHRKKQGLLDYADRANYELAMEREKVGKVRPLSE